MLGTKTITTPAPLRATLKDADQARIGTDRDGHPVTAYRKGRTVMQVIEHPLGVRVVTQVFPSVNQARRFMARVR